MNFLRFEGRLINFDKVDWIKKTTDTSKIRLEKVKSSDSEIEEVIEVVDGSPFEITIDSGHHQLKLTYPTKLARDNNFNLLITILKVPN
jgi:hypothetical protein